MSAQVTLVTAPALRSLDWEADVKPALRLSDDTEKGWIESLLVPAAEGWAETATGRSLITQTWMLRLPCFPANGARIILPYPPLQSVSSVSYVDPNGDTQTWATALWETETPAPAGERAAHGHVWPAYGQAYPTTRIHPNSVSITFIAGYGDDYEDIPAGLRQAMLMVIADKFIHRETTIEGIGTIIADVPMGAEYMVGSYLAELA